MVRRPHLSLVPGNGLGSRLGASSRRAAGALVALLAVAGLLYLAARETPVFAVREVEVSGGPPGVRRSVLAAAEQHLGESLVALDRGDVRRSLEALPTVRRVEIDRAFPHTLRISVAPERPLAVLRRGKKAWLLSARGRVIRQVDPAAAPHRPRIQLPAETPVATGEIVRTRPVRLALAALRRLPERFPVRVEAARAEGGSIVLELRDGPEVRLGGRSELPLKLEVAARVLRKLPPVERAALVYLDVAVPERPVGGTSLNSQVEPET